MEAINDVVTVKHVSLRDAVKSLTAETLLSTSNQLSSETFSAPHPSNPVFASAECNKRVSQSDRAVQKNHQSEGVSQPHGGEDQSERFLQLNWKEMVGVLANQVTAMLKTITNQTLPLENFLQT